MEGRELLDRIVHLLSLDDEFPDEASYLVVNDSLMINLRGAGQEQILTLTVGLHLTPKAKRILEEVLVYHYRADISSCGCGWSELGKSHPRHVVQVFEDSLKARIN